MDNITFVTGNKNKATEFQQIIGTKFKIKHVNVDLPELQGNLNQITRAKLDAAINNGFTGFNVIIEDSALQFTALGGMPGPYIKWYLDAMSLPDIVKTLDSFANKSAVAVATFGLYYDGKKYFFESKVEGNIVPPIGDNGFGWDAIFKPDNSTQTFAEMSKDDKNKFSPRALALREVVEFLNNI